MIVIAIQMEAWPTQPKDVMQKANATASVPLVDWNVTNVWTFTSDFPIVKITVWICVMKPKIFNNYTSCYCF